MWLADRQKVGRAIPANDTWIAALALQHRLPVMSRGRRDVVDAIECKWRAEAFETRGLRAFRAIYPKGHNDVVSPIDGGSYNRTVDTFQVSFVSLADFAGVFG